MCSEPLLDLLETFTKRELSMPSVLNTKTARSVYSCAIKLNTLVYLAFFAPVTESYRSSEV